MHEAMRLILRIALDTPLRRLFDYLAPVNLEPGTLVPGKRVRVPFGRRRLTGMLLEVAERSAVPGHKLKAALEVLDAEPVLDPDLLAFLEWAAEYYHHPIGEVIAAALPLSLRAGRPAERAEERWHATGPAREAALAALSRAPRQRAMLEHMLSQDAMTASELAQMGPRWRETLRELVRRNWVALSEAPKVPVRTSGWATRTGPSLTD